MQRATENAHPHGSTAGAAEGTSLASDYLIDIRDVSKSFSKKGETVAALAPTSLRVRRGEFVCLVGPSGCGKSTLLNMVAGLMRPSTGELSYAQRPLPQPNTSVGYITQQDNLLPWRTVNQNVALALEIKGMDRDSRENRVSEMLELVGLSGFEDAYPHELSGGMKKRASLARTLIYDPETLLADEPFGALDAQLKLVLQEEMLRLWRQRSSTVLFVTHDLSEAITLADRVVLFSPRPGHIRLIQEIDIPRPRDVFRVRFSSRFGELHEELWSRLSEDLRQGEGLQ